MRSDHALTAAGLRRRLLPAALAGAALALAGCAALPPATPAAALHEGRFTLPAGSADGAAWPGDGWWRAYGDAQLDALIGEALAQSPDLAAAQARLTLADAATGVASAANLDRKSGV